MDRLKGKVAVITGGASGIGRATAQLFAVEGASVAVGDINDAGGEETIGLIEKTGGKAMFVHTDVSVMDDCQRLVSSAVERFGGLHILHNDAFWSDHNHTVVELSEGSWDRTLDVSLKAMFLMSKFAIPEILRSGGGSIVNMASAVALMGSRGNPAYAAAKGGVIALTKAMAIDYGKQGIRVNCIAPGAVATPANAHLRRDPDYHKRSMSRMLLSRLTQPDDIANAVLFLASDESAQVTGTTLVVDAGATSTPNWGPPTEGD